MVKAKAVEVDSSPESRLESELIERTQFTRSRQEERVCCAQCSESVDRRDGVGARKRRRHHLAPEARHVHVHGDRGVRTQRRLPL